MDKPEILSVNVGENINTEDKFGKGLPDELKDKLKKAGVVGTLRLTKEENRLQTIDAAWKLSKDTGGKVVIVVQAS